MMHKERGCKYDTLTFKGRLLGVQIVLYTHISKLQYIPYTIYTCQLVFLPVSQLIYITTRQCSVKILRNAILQRQVYKNYYTNNRTLN